MAALPALRWWSCAGALLLATLAGCAGHEARVATALEALDRGAPEEALAELNSELEVDSAEQLPRDMMSDDALLVLDRATVLQSLDRYQLSARDFGAADKAIEVLDLSRGAADELGRYLFSDDVGRYRAPAFEKLLLNTFNLMNYLALRDLSGARVEARRLAIMQKHLQDERETTAMLGLGSVLAGFAFEKSGRPEEALRYYEEALAYASYPSLVAPLRVLTRGEPTTPRIRALLGGAGPLPAVQETGEAELLVVIGYGRVPQKVPTRIPIGLALTLVAHHISPRDHARANELAVKGLVTWVNFPRLGPSRGRYSVPQVLVDGRAVGLEHALDVEAEVRREWDEREPTVVLSAITRMLARAAVGEVTQAATGAANKKNEAGGVLGLLAGLAATAALSAADTPDTRSWSTLPSNVAVARLRVPAGRHTVQVHVRGVTRTYDVDVQPGDWAFIGASALR